LQIAGKTVNDMMIINITFLSISFLFL
jgi:hypothetical protein